MNNGRTKSEAETAIRNAVIKFEQEFMGRGPMDVRAFILRDLVLVRLKGVLTQAERQLAKSTDGIEMVKAMRQNLISQGRENSVRTSARSLEQMSRVYLRILIRSLENVSLCLLWIKT